MKTAEVSVCLGRCANGEQPFAVTKGTSWDLLTPFELTPNVQTCSWGCLPDFEFKSFGRHSSHVATMDPVGRANLNPIG